MRTDDDKEEGVKKVAYAFKNEFTCSPIYLFYFRARAFASSRKKMGNIMTGLFAPADDFEKSDVLYIGAVISTVRIYASVLVWINILLQVALLLVSLVPGAALGGSPVGFSSLPHTVWSIGNLLPLIYVLTTVSATSYVDIDGVTGSLVAGMIFMLASIGANIIHIVSLALECSEQSSTFYLQGFPYLVVYTVAIGVFILWQMWIAARLWVYRGTIMAAIQRGWNPLSEMGQLAANRNGYTKIPGSDEQQQQLNAPLIKAPLLFSTVGRTSTKTD